MSLVMRIGRYVMHDEIASGGMGAVHLGLALGSGGFSRLVAIKRLHPHLASLPAALAAFMDEARLSARVHHPNVVATLDVLDHDGELLLVMDYVHGTSLAALADAARSADTKIPVAVAVAITIDVLSGLHAIHDAKSEKGDPLSIVHRDISPQNILVGGDGNARVADFGIAKAATRLQTTTDGRIKGKLRYMAPEQFLNMPLDPRTDAFSAGIVLWELLTGTRLFEASSEGAVVARVLEGVILPPSRHSPDLSPDLDAVVLRSLSRKPEERFASCRDMASALRAVVAPAPADDVGRWVQSLVGDLLRERATRVAQIETGQGAEVPRPAPALAAATMTMTMTAKKAVTSEPLPRLAGFERAARPGHAPPGEGAAQPACESSRPHLPLRRVRSTLLVASYRMVQKMGRAEAYLRALPQEHHAPIIAAVAGSWVAVDSAIAHYQACEALGLESDEQVDIGRTVGAQVRGTLFGTIVYLSKEVGATPWSVFPSVPRLWPRLFDGSAIAIWNLGPKEARLDITGLPLVDVPYFCNALRGQIMGMLDLFCTRTYVTTSPRNVRPGVRSMRIQWA